MENLQVAMHDVQVVEIGETAQNLLRVVEDDSLVEGPVVLEEAGDRPASHPLEEDVALNRIERRRGVARARRAAAALRAARVRALRAGVVRRALRRRAGLRDRRHRRAEDAENVRVPQAGQQSHLNSCNSSAVLNSDHIKFA